MSCFDLTTCTPNQIFNRINCNFTVGYIKYVCNPTNTCTRSDGLYDCCSSNISDCIVEYVTLQLLPTTSPTISPNIMSSCETTCNLTPNINKCYWYESQNKDISCVDKNDNYCCSHSRSECCQTSSLYAYIILGSLFMLFMCCFCYTLFVYKYTRVKPDTSQPPSPQISI